MHSQVSKSLYPKLVFIGTDNRRWYGIDKILNILRLKVEKYKESVYIISHKTSTKSNIDNTILLEKRNGETSFVN